VLGDGINPPLSQNKIASKLTEMKILTRGDKKEHVAKKYPKYAWRPATIRSILNQEAYTGTWFYGKTKMVNGKQISRDRNEWIAVSVPKIIDRDLYDKAQKMIQQNIEMSKRNNKYQYLLRGRIKCSKCGYSYIGRTRRNNNQYYYCKGKEQKPLNVCDMPQFRADSVNNAVWSWIEEILLQPEKLAARLKENQKLSNQINKRLYSQLDLVDRQIEKNG
jgi:site-specific DNA recombinase